MKRTKSGSLQLSIEAIVVLIIAITVLGLGLSFVKSLFGGTMNKLTSISDSLGEEDKRTLTDSGADITFLTSDIRVSGKDESVNFAIRNNRRTTLNFRIKDGFNCTDAIGKPEDFGLGAGDVLGKKTKIPMYIAFSTFEFREVSAGKSDVIPLAIAVDSTAPPTVYSCKLNLTIADSTNRVIGDYAIKGFNIIKQ